MRHPHPGIAGDDVDVFPRSRIPADESQAIEGLHDLAGPPKFDAVDHGEAFAGPPLEATMPPLSIVRLSRFVIFTADDQDLVRRLAVDRMDAHVVIGVVHVPIQISRHRSRRHARADHVRHVRRLFRTHEEAVVDGRVRRHHDRLCADGVAAGHDVSILATFDMIDMRTGEQLPAVILDRACQPGDVLQRMKLTLLRITDARTRIEEVEGRPCQARDRQAGTANRR